MEEFALCAINPSLFFRQYVWIQNKNTAQVIRWSPWSYLLDLINIIESHSDVIILKARQLGISWLLCGYGLCKTLFNESAKVMFLSQGEQEAWEMVTKARFIYTRLPEYMRFSLLNDTRSQLTFGDTMSEIKAYPSTEKAGRGTDATVIVRDELANHPYASRNFTAISPAIDSGGKLVDLSTIDKFAGMDDPSYHFTERVLRIYQGATKTEYDGLEVYKNPSHPESVLVFLPWTLRPVRQEGMTLEEWFNLKVKPKYTQLEIEQEYPATIKEALKTPETNAFFDRDALEDMLLSVCDTIKTDEINTFGDTIRIYKLPQVGKIYVLFTDPSDGIEDPFVSVVMDVQTGEGIASATGKLKADVCAKVHDTLARFYNAYHSYDENATAGGKFDETINLLQTPKLMARRDADGKIQYGKRGYQINPQIRAKMLDGLEEAVRRRLIIPHDREAMNQMTIFSRIDGKAQAPRKMHDDWVMAWAGAWHISKYVPRGEVKITSGHYKG